MPATKNATTRSPVDGRFIDQRHGSTQGKKAASEAIVDSMKRDRAERVGAALKQASSATGIFRKA